jgi:hypothetical protein
MAGAVRGDGVVGVGAEAGVAGAVDGATAADSMEHVALRVVAASRMVQWAVSTVERPEASTLEQLAVSMAAVDFMEVAGSTVVAVAVANRQ